MADITLRVALAKSQMRAADLRRATKADGPPLSFDTINKILDGIPDEGISLSTLRRIERAVPGIRLEVRFVETDRG